MNSFLTHILTGFLAIQVIIAVIWANKAYFDAMHNYTDNPDIWYIFIFFTIYAFVPLIAALKIEGLL